MTVDVFVIKKPANYLEYSKIISIFADEKQGAIHLPPQGRGLLAHFIKWQMAIYR